MSGARPAASDACYLASLHDLEGSKFEHVTCMGSGDGLAADPLNSMRAINAPGFGRFGLYVAGFSSNIKNGGSGLIVVASIRNRPRRTG